MTSGLLPPLLFLNVAILLILTESLVDMIPIFLKIKQYINYIAVMARVIQTGHTLINKSLLLITCCFLLAACSEPVKDTSGTTFRYNISNGYLESIDPAYAKTLD